MLNSEKKNDYETIIIPISKTIANANKINSPNSDSNSKTPRAYGGASENNNNDNVNTLGMERVQSFQSTTITTQALRSPKEQSLLLFDKKSPNANSNYSYNYNSNYTINLPN